MNAILPAPTPGCECATCQRIRKAEQEAHPTAEETHRRQAIVDLLAKSAKGADELNEQLRPQFWRG